MCGGIALPGENKQAKRQCGKCMRSLVLNGHWRWVATQRSSTVRRRQPHIRNVMKGGAAENQSLGDHVPNHDCHVAAFFPFPSSLVEDSSLPEKGCVDPILGQE